MTHILTPETVKKNVKGHVPLARALFMFSALKAGKIKLMNNKHDQHNTMIGDLAKELHQLLRNPASYKVAIDTFCLLIEQVSVYLLLSRSWFSAQG